MTLQDDGLPLQEEYKRARKSIENDYRLNPDTAAFLEPHEVLELKQMVLGIFDSLHIITLERNEAQTKLGELERKLEDEKKVRTILRDALDVTKDRIVGILYNDKEQFADMSLNDVLNKMREDYGHDDEEEEPKEKQLFYTVQPNGDVQAYRAFEAREVGDELREKRIHAKIYSEDKYQAISNAAPQARKSFRNTTLKHYTDEMGQQVRQMYYRYSIKTSKGEANLELPNLKAVFDFASRKGETLYEVKQYLNDDTELVLFAQMPQTGSAQYNKLYYVEAHARIAGSQGISQEKHTATILAFSRDAAKQYLEKEGFKVAGAFTEEEYHDRVSSDKRPRNTSSNLYRAPDGTSQRRAEYYYKIMTNKGWIDWRLPDVRAVFQKAEREGLDIQKITQDIYDGSVRTLWEKGKVVNWLPAPVMKSYLVTEKDDNVYEIQAEDLTKALVKAKDMSGNNIASVKKVEE